MIAYSKFKLLSIYKKKKKNKTPILHKKPQRKGICVKPFILTPKKPNSAKRKVAKLRFYGENNIVAYIPGSGHNLKDYSIVLIRGGRSQDLPAVKYHIIRGKLDLIGVPNRKTARSKYGVKKAKKSTN